MKFDMTLGANEAQKGQNINGGPIRQLGEEQVHTAIVELAYPVADEGLISQSHGVGGSHAIACLRLGAVDLFKEIAAVGVTSRDAQKTGRKGAGHVHQIAQGIACSQIQPSAIGSARGVAARAARIPNGLDLGAVIHIRCFGNGV